MMLGFSQHLVTILLGHCAQRIREFDSEMKSGIISQLEGYQCTFHRTRVVSNGCFPI
jgi:hypothetical protein